MSYLGLDLGTSSLKALLIGEHDEVLGEASAPLEVAHPKAGWSEQDPMSWISACEAVMAELARTAPAALAGLKAIGLSGHMHGAVLLDGADRVLRPCMLWNDTRSAREAGEMDAEPLFRQVSGNIVFPGFTAPKVEWVRRHEPEVFAKLAKVLLPKDFLRLWLTGEHVSDMSDAAGTTWLDVGKRAWSGEALERCGLDLGQMPALVEGTGISGQLRPALAAGWGVRSSVDVVGGGGDNAAAAVGTGCVGEGDAFVSLGTSGVLLAARDGYAPDPETAVHTFCHALPGQWYQMGVILAATDCLNWLAARVGQSAESLSRDLPEVAEGPSEITFLPYLSGERTPHNDAKIRAALIGMDVGHTTGDLTRAVMEGVAFALADSLSALRSTGARVDRVIGVGGGTASPFWVSTLANILGVPVDLPDGSQMGAALGAARLARGGGFEKPAVAGSVEPEARFARAYEEAQARYRALYPALKDMG